MELLYFPPFFSCWSGRICSACLAQRHRVEKVLFSWEMVLDPARRPAPCQIFVRQGRGSWESLQHNKSPSSWIVHRVYLVVMNRGHNVDARSAEISTGAELRTGLISQLTCVGRIMFWRWCSCLEAECWQWLSWHELGPNCNVVGSR